VSLDSRGDNERGARALWKVIKMDQKIASFLILILAYMPVSCNRRKNYQTLISNENPNDA
jgi:hypothetical protein